MLCSAVMNIHIRCAKTRNNIRMYKNRRDVYRAQICKQYPINSDIINLSDGNIHRALSSTKEDKYRRQRTCTVANGMYKYIQNNNCNNRISREETANIFANYNLNYRYIHLYNIIKNRFYFHERVEIPFDRKFDQGSKYTG